MSLSFSSTGAEAKPEPELVARAAALGWLTLCCNARDPLLSVGFAYVDADHGD